MNRSKTTDTDLLRNAFARALSRAVVVLKEWRRRSRSRRELRQFDERQLRDIGLSMSQASFETGKSFLQY